MDDSGMWTLIPTGPYERRYKRYTKKKNNQLDAVVANLNIFLNHLNAGGTPKPFTFGFLHSEPSDVIAIDQSGSKGKVAATRLYILADVASENLYLLTIGDKSTQSDDIQDCKRMAAQIKSLALERIEHGTDQNQESDETEDEDSQA